MGVNDFGIPGYGGITHFGNSKGKTGLNMEAVPGTCTVRIFSGKTNPTLILNQFFHKSLTYLSEISNHFLHKRLHRCHIDSFEFFQVDCTVKVNMFANFSQDC